VQRAQERGFGILRTRGCESETDIQFAGLLELRERIPEVQARALGSAPALEPPTPFDRFAVPAGMLGRRRGGAASARASASGPGPSRDDKPGPQPGLSSLDAMWPAPRRSVPAPRWAAMWFGVTEEACAAFLSVTPPDASCARAPERSATRRTSSRRDAVP
jgi:hypothetical protein